MSRRPPLTGLTLAEVMLAIGLCVVVVLSVIALSIAALRSGVKSTDVVVAQGYGTQVLDRFIAGLPPSSDPFWGQSSFVNPYLQDQAQLGTTLYQASLSLSPLTSAPAGLMQVTVNVTWRSGQQGGAGQGTQLSQLARIVYGH